MSRLHSFKRWLIVEEKVGNRWMGLAEFNSHRKATKFLRGGVDADIREFRIVNHREPRYTLNIYSGVFGGKLSHG